MQSGTLGEVPTYIQPDHFESEKKNMNGFLGQNPLLLLARTCQNIGIEPKSSGNCGNQQQIQFSNRTSPNYTKQASSPKSLASMQPTVSSTGMGVNSHLSTSSPSPTSVKSGVDETDLQIPPSSNSLIQLARLSSSLKIPCDGNSRQQKRSKPMETLEFQQQHHHQKRGRRQSFGRVSSQPLDYTHHSPHSSPLSSSSVSPSSLRSTPPTAHSNSASYSSIQLMKNLMELTSASPGCLETFYNVGNMFGAPPDRLKELFLNVAHSVILKKQVAMEEVRCPAPQPPSFSDPSTQCLYCGHVCADMGSLVQHIYTHLASLHKATTQPPQAVAVTQNHNQLCDYLRYLQKPVEPSPPVADVLQPQTSTATSDPNALFLFWLNLFRPAYSEALSRTTS